MKIKDLPENQSLLNVRFVAPDGNKYYWQSQWNKGVWAKKDLNSEQIYPIIIGNILDALEWEIVD